MNTWQCNRQFPKRPSSDVVLNFCRAEQNCNLVRRRMAGNQLWFRRLARVESSSGQFWSRVTILHLTPRGNVIWPKQIKIIYQDHLVWRDRIAVVLESCSTAELLEFNRLLNLIQSKAAGWFRHLASAVCLSNLIPELSWALQSVTSELGLRIIWVFRALMSGKMVIRLFLLISYAVNAI